MRSRQQRLKTRSLRRRFLVLVGETEPGEQREGAHGENGDQGGSAEDVANVPHCARGIRNRGESPGRSAQEEQEVAGGANGVEENGEVPVAKGQSIEDGGATPEIEREELVENVNAQIPAEEVGYGNAEISAAVRPNPAALDGRPNRILGKVPRDQAKSREGISGVAVPEDEEGEGPGDVAHSEIGESEQNRHVKELRAHAVGEIVVSEGKAGHDAEILDDVADHEKQEEERQDGAATKKRRAVEEGEEERGNDVHRGDHGDRNFVGEEWQESCGGVEREEGPERDIRCGESFCAEVFVRHEALIELRAPEE